MLKGAILNITGVLFIVGPLLITNLFSDEKYEFGMGSALCLTIGLILALMGIRIQIMSEKKEKY